MPLTEQTLTLLTYSFAPNSSLCLYCVNIVFIFLKDCVALFQALPVETWRPKVRDIQTIRNWLLRSPVESSEHQLSRYLLTNINWQYQVCKLILIFLASLVFLCSYSRPMKNGRWKF